MSTVYLATDPEPLAERLAAALDDELRGGDLFEPTTIVAPNRLITKWLRLWLARRLGVAINLRFLRLEQAIWEMLRQIDPRRQPQPLHLLDHEAYRLMVLSVLLGGANEALRPLNDYWAHVSSPKRASWRRLWHLADRLAGLIRDYEYHRQSTIQHWIRGELSTSGRTELERGQREIFQQIIREPDGKRALLGLAAGKLFKTLPQYAQELMLDVPASNWHGLQAARPIHVFGIAHISALHWTTLNWLADKLDLRLYYLNPLCGAGFPACRERNLEEDPCTLRRVLGQAGAESLRLMFDRLEPERWRFANALKPSRERQQPEETVLSRLQQLLLSDEVAFPARLPQDRSLQIVPCPGIHREVETVHNSIVHNLQVHPDLKQTDIVVLVTDMEQYRPALQAVFDREPRRLLYNLADFSAAGLSVFGQALVEMLDLALESFTRSRVFSVLLNPCFLARLGVERGQALGWLSWAQSLGIYHGWDGAERKERGYADSPFFGWQLGLRRLRLGRIMEVAPEGTTPAARFHEIIPYADLASADTEQLDGFCRGVEGLLPALTRLRKFQGTGKQWADEIERFVMQFLDIPPDRPEERQVRDRLMRALQDLALLDQMSAAPNRFPIALIREYVLDSLEHLEGTRGEFLTGGVTITSLSQFRQAPFRVLYVLGLGEELFPGTNALPTFDLRSEQRQLGDIRPAELNRGFLMEALLAARDKLYLLYNCRDLQRDQDLHPSVPLVQLRRFVEEHIVTADFRLAKVSLTGCGLSALHSVDDEPFDACVNYNETDRTLAALEAQRLDLLTPKQAEALKRRLDQAERRFTAAAGSKLRRDEAATVSLRELANFLHCPAEAAIRRHLGLEDDEDRDDEDDEPFLTDNWTATRLKNRLLEQFIADAGATSLDAALAAWPEHFARLYDDWQLQCRLPERPYCDIDHAALRAELQDRIQGEDGLAGFLRRREEAECCGPILIGESPLPIGARTIFPAVQLRLTHNLPLVLPESVRLVGSFPLVWRSKRTLELLSFWNGKVKESEIARPLLLPFLFYLALRAGNDAACSSRRWLDARALHVHIAHSDGISTFAYTASELSPAVAGRYLRELCADFLDPGGFDLLPLPWIAHKDLSAAYTLPEEEAVALADGYQQQLQDAIDEDDEDFPTYHRMRLLEIVAAQVPGDAFAKVRRRFCLLDRAPARQRKSSTPAKEEEGESRRQPRQARRS